MFVIENYNIFRSGRVLKMALGRALEGPSKGAEIAEKSTLCPVDIAANRNPGRLAATMPHGGPISAAPAG
jgi:hypothetical protein